MKKNYYDAVGLWWSEIGMNCEVLMILRIVSIGAVSF